MPVDIPASGGIQTEVVADPTVQARPLNITPNAPFVLRAHPDRWGLFKHPVTGEDLLLPILGSRVLSPGVNGVDRRGDDTLARAKDLRKGWVEIPSSLCKPEHTPDGRPGYLRRVKCRGGHFYMTPWTTLRPVGNNVSIADPDPGYYNWLAALVEAGKIPPPSDGVRELLIERYGKRADRKTDAAGKNPYAAGALEREKERAEAANHAVVPGEQPDAAHPTPRKRSSKAAT